MRTKRADQRRGRVDAGSGPWARGAVATDRGRARRRWQPDLVSLEDRRLLSTFTVTSMADDGSAHTLRWAVAQANAATSPSSIEIDPGTSAATIALTQGQLELTNTAKPVTIDDGPGQGPVTVSGNQASRVFQVDAKVTATITGLTIAGGSTSGNGGGVYNAGTLTLDACTVKGNTGFAGGGLANAGTLTLTDCTVSGNSGAGSGGGLSNLGTANLTACTLSGNTTTGASGGTGGYNGTGYGNTGSGAGGAVFNHGTVNLTNCTTSGNTAVSAAGLFEYGQGTLTACTLSGDVDLASRGATGIYVYSDPNTEGRLVETDTLVSEIGIVSVTSGAVGGASIGPITGSNNLNESGPGFPIGALGNYGGPTETIPLLPGNPAIGGGIAVPGITTDQRGEPLDSPHPDIGAFQSQGFTLTAAKGSTPQSTAISTAFANPLAITVTANNPVEPVAGGVIAFTAPSSGASASLSATSVTLATGGVASVTAKANATGGSYDVIASAGGGSTLDFALSNVASIAFSGITDQTITYGTPTLAVSGTLADGSQAPQGETVTLTLDGVQKSATIGSGGAFSATFDTSSLSVSGSPYTISYSYAGDGSYAPVSTTSALTVTQATPTIDWPDPADIVYGTALGATQLDATASVPGSFTYTPAAGTVLKAGAGQTLSVAFAPKDATDYTTASATATINAKPATPTITWPDPADILYGTALSSTQLDAKASVPGTFTYTPAAGTVLKAGAGQTLSVSFTPTDATDYTTASATAKLNVTRAAPTIAWPDPADITYGTPLGAAQLDAAASWVVNGSSQGVAGTFAYTPAAGTVLKAGTNQTLSVSFTPTDTTDYTGTTATATINVAQATPTIDWADPADITYGTPLSSTQLDAAASWIVAGSSAAVAGSFTYTPAAGTVLGAGSGRTLSVAFAPTDTNDYTTATAKATINVKPATPTIDWTDPAGITYGTALSSAQLDATASVPGTFAYTPAAGTVLKAGAGQTLSVAFTPTDSTDYTSTNATATINVARATPTITWSDPADITYGTPLGAAQLDAAASWVVNGSSQGVAGTFAYTPAAGTVLKAGAGQLLSVSFTPTDAKDYTAASATATINVTRATPAITWPDPADITYGMALSTAQLDATASVPGTFTYTPTAGTVLKAGANQTLSVAFAPTDTTDYVGTTASATISVKPATPIIDWPDPAGIAYGTPLSSAQLDANASVPGTFAYTPAAGTILKVGTRTLSVSFTPTDTTDYTSTTATATIGVAPATPMIEWSDPAGITYGTALTIAQLDATASVPGTFTYTPAAGALLKAGANQTLSVSFTPTDTTDYTGTTAAATINVARATPTIDWPDPAPIAYGTPMSATQLDATPSWTIDGSSQHVAGTFTYTPAAGTILDVGNGQTLSASFTPTDTADYTGTTATATIDVDAVAPVITWPDPADLAFGTALGPAQLDATANIPGTFAYTPPPGTILPAGAGQTLSVTFTPQDPADHPPVTASTAITVARATPTIALTAPGGTFDGSPFPASVTIAGPGSGNAPAASLEDVAPVLTYYLGASTAGTVLGSTPPSAPGTYTVVARFPGSADYAATDSLPVTFSIAMGTPALALTSSAEAAVFGQSVTLVATLRSPATPGGTVTFYDGPTPIGTAPVDASGTATLTTASLALGAHALTARYGGDADLLASTSGAVAESVAPAATQVVLVPRPVFRRKKVVALGLQAEIQPIAPGAGVPTGTVTFEMAKKARKKVREKVLGTMALGDGTVTLTVKPNKVLKKPITILYGGDADFAPSTSTPPPLRHVRKGLARPLMAPRGRRP